METLNDLDLTVPRSCWNCHKKKVKCDRSQPCSTCLRSGASCTYPDIDQRKKSRRIPVNALLSRLAQLEKKVSTLSKVPQGDVATPAATPENGSTERPLRSTTSEVEEHKTYQSVPHGAAGVLLNHGGESRYIGDSFMASLAQDAKQMSIDENEAVLDYEEHSRSIPSTMLNDHQGRTIGASLFLDSKSGWRALRLWQLYQSNVEPLMKILHVPSTQNRLYAAMQNPRAAEATQNMLLNSICFAAMISLDHEEVQHIFYLDRGTLMQYYRDETEKYIGKVTLMTAPNLEYLQALTIFISTLRVIDNTRAVWILTGLAIRIAQSLGIHMDGKALNLSPFDIELRRRVWWHIFLLEIRAAEDHGLAVSDFCVSGHSPLYPSNINDEDIWPGMTEPPVPSAAGTSATLTLIRIQLADKMTNLGLNSVQAIDTQGLLQHIEETRRKIRAGYDQIALDWLSTAEQKLQSYYVAASRLLEFSLKKADFLILFRSYQSPLLDAQTEEKIREATVINALALVERLNQIEADTSLKRFWWYAKSNPQWFTVGFLLQQLYRGSIKDPELRQRAQSAIEEIFAFTSIDARTSTVQRKGAIWVALQLLKDKTFSKYSSSDLQPGLVEAGRTSNTGEFPTPDSDDLDALDHMFDFNSFDFSQMGSIDMSLFDSHYNVDTIGLNG